MKPLFFVPKVIEIGPLHITLYAICILIGAVTAYKLSQFFLKKRGYDPEAIENLFYIAFPSGIVGARIWYVIANFSKEFAGREWWKVFAIWEGGLAIQGGVIGGVVVGVIFMIKRRPNIPVLLATDCIVPTILVAQCIGRWGNFFNQEVYGGCVERWRFLPNFITDRLTIALNFSGNGWNTTGNGNLIYLCGDADHMVLPLFLIEGTLNLVGFFLIAFAVPALFRWISKKTKGKCSLADGDLMCVYLIWYGALRALLEPLRNNDYIMGNYTSVYMSIAFVIVGAIGIVLCHLYRNKWQKKILKTNVIPGSEAEKEAVDISQLENDEKEN